VTNLVGLDRRTAVFQALAYSAEKHPAPVVEAIAHVSKSRGG
jgi:hypothetical protein